MTGWIGFAAAWLAFFASHFIPSLPGLRDRLIAAMGRRAYFSTYGMLSLLLLAWLIVAAARAPHVGLWPQLPWMRLVPNVAMPLAFVLGTCGLGLRQPYTPGGKRSTAFDPARPGLAAVCRHPLMLALALWAGAHLLPNGDLAHVILFGGFAALALGAIPIFDARARRALPPAEARAFFDATAILSLRPSRLRHIATRAMAIRAGLGLALWYGALHLHGAVIGVSPYPLW